MQTLRREVQGCAVQPSVSLPVPAAVSCHSKQPVCTGLFPNYPAAKTHATISTSGFQFLEVPAASELESTLQADSGHCSCLIPAWPPQVWVWTLWSRAGHPRGAQIAGPRPFSCTVGTAVTCTKPWKVLDAPGALTRTEEGQTPDVSLSPLGAVGDKYCSPRIPMHHIFRRGVLTGILVHRRGG